MMKGFLRFVVSTALTAIVPALAQVHSPSCYTTTTVVFGNPASMLESLSMVSNITALPLSTVSSSSPSSLASIHSLTSSTSSTISFTDPQVTGLFRVTVNVPDPVKLRERGLEYLSFNENNVGSLEPDSSLATLFQLVNGYLKTSAGFYVGADTNEGYARFEIASFPPAVAQGFSTNNGGSITLINGAGFCYDGNGTLYIIFTQRPEFNCTAAILIAAEAAATTSSVVVSKSATLTSIIQTPAASSSVLAVPTSTLLDVTSTSGGNVQGTSLSSLSFSTTHPAVLAPSTSILSISSISALSSSSIIIPPASSTTVAPASSTRPSVIVVSTSPSTSSLQLALTSSSSSVSPVVSNPTNIIGPGQLSTPVSSIFSLPFSVSSIPSSTSTVASSSTGFSSSGTTSSSSIAISSTTGILFSAIPSSTSTSILTTTITSASSSSSSSSSSSTSTFPVLPSPYARNTGKRGLAYTNITLTQLYSLQGQNSKVSWSYDYYSLPNASDNRGPVNPVLTFIPLLYNNAASLTSIWATNVNYSITHYNTDAIFSFNEPDACNNGQSACMSVSASVAAYRSYMQPFAGRVALGAPSVTNGGPPSSLTYLSYFLGNCTGCTIDFINLHWYASPYSFSYLTSYIQQAYAVGGNRPIYLTEFGMDSVYYNEADVAAFMRNATTWLDAQSYVLRYSWFGDFAQTGPQTQQGFGYLVNNQGSGLSAEGVVFNNYTGGYVACPHSSC